MKNFVLLSHLENFPCLVFLFYILYVCIYYLLVFTWILNRQCVEPRKNRTAKWLFGQIYKYDNCKVFSTIFQNAISLMHVKNCHMIQKLLLRNIYFAFKNEARFIFHLTFFACFFADFVSVMLLSDWTTREIQKMHAMKFKKSVSLRNSQFYSTFCQYLIMRTERWQN